jgi:predicted transcriptional regulator
MTTKPKLTGQPKGKPKLRPTTQEKTTIISMTAAGVSQTKIADSIGRSRSLVKHTLDEPETQLAVSNERRQMSEECMDKGRTIVLSITQENIDKAGLKDKVISAAILFDKGLLLAGEAPQYSVTVLVDAVAALREMRENSE